jgi:hypothetical protein
MGQLIPVMCDEVVPGDFFQIGNQAVIRFQPLVAPILHEINMYTHYFFVPYRLLWDEFEEFITGGFQGSSTVSLPKWWGSNRNDRSLWDYLGLPLRGGGQLETDLTLPISFPRDAYNLVYNEFYRDETLQPEVSHENEVILHRNWEKDYFTSALPWQQRGVAPALPISGFTSAVWANNVDLVWPPVPSSGSSATINYTDGDLRRAPFDADSKLALEGGKVLREGGLTALNDNTVDLSHAATFDVSDLRLAFQIQKWMERNARSGARYTEFLQSHFGVSPRDERLQRPEYIGGSKTPIIISEVLQTSATQTGSAQGNLAGHGIAISDSFCGKYHASEFGLIIGIMSVMPRSSYSQGLSRQWIKNTKYDFYFPEFAHLSEQAIFNAEIYLNDEQVTNESVFGYQGRYDELRTKQNMVVAGMRSDFDYWHLSREFAEIPLLNSTFITCLPRKDIFAVPSEPGLIVSYANLIKAFRPMPVKAEPGLIDHN